MRSKQSGFTLVEIAIVLVIIGLLLGGVLKGQELINSAKIKGIVNDLNGLSTAVYAYQDRYKALPGDDALAGTRWTAIAAPGNGNAKIEGTFNSATATDETLLFWRELRLANLVGGDIASGTQPQNSVGGVLGVQAGAGDPTVGANLGLAGLVACQTNLLGRVAEAVDNQLDDGKPNAGALKAWKQSGLVALDGGITAVDITAKVGGTVPDATYVDDGSTMYTVCKTIL
ncbi:MAG: prepilin-type N-terminal cleavage/methylation domain-containing protein [Sulfuritalea sp.]|nr:prepilin-type N-terminal cleavage/methylation domain-containing protein [Sulfuritalea sp.]